MICLQNAKIIGEGRDRICYEHPDNPALCIKVAKRKEKQTRREKRYFKLLKKQKKNMHHLANYCGTVSTDRGNGAIFELIRNLDGSVSPTLREAIEAHLIRQKALDSLIEDLRNYLFSQAICVRDLSPSNVVLQHATNGHQLKIIDGVSNPGVNPLNLRWRWLARRFLHKSWMSFIRKLNTLHSRSNSPFDT